MFTDEHELDVKKYESGVFRLKFVYLFVCSRADNICMWACITQNWILMKIIDTMEFAV